MKKILLVLFLFNNPLIFSQNQATLDTSFNSGLGSNGDIESIALQPDGKILIGGYFTSYNNIPRNKIARLNSDGSLDTSFSSGAISNGIYIHTIAVQSDGKILIGGLFTASNNTTENIARLNSDGTLDTTFNAGTGTTPFEVSDIVLSNNKIIIAGEFDNYNNTSINRIACLNSTGVLDNTLNPGIGTNNYIDFIIVQPDGKIIIGGGFTTFNGTSKKRLARLNSNGTLDNTFNVGLGADDYIHSAFLQTDGKIIIGGAFNTFNGIAINSLARLNSNGTLDNTFNTSLSSTSTIASITSNSDGKIIISGSFSTYNSINRNNIAQLNSNGTLDTSFDSSTGSNGVIVSTAIQPDGKILIGGYFTSYGGVLANRIARLMGNNSLNTQSYTKEKISIYPNPTKDKFLISTNEIIESIDIYNSLGNNIYQKESTNKELNIEFLPVGFYTLKVKTSSGYSTTKLIKN